MYVFPKKVTLLITAKQKVARPAASLRYSTTLFVVVSFCRVSLHDNMEFNAAFVFFKSFSTKHGKKGKEKRNDYSVIEQNALKRQLYGKYFKRFPSNNDRSK